MKKILMAVMLAVVTSGAFAADADADANSKSVAVSKSQGGTGGASTVSGVNASNGLTVGCLVNCASTDSGSKDLADSAVQSALINAQAARDVAAAMRDTTATIKNTPSVNGPNLVSSNDTCMGSTSGSVNIAGLGIGGGTSWVDNNCKMLKNAREFWNMGMKGAALALMCTDSANKEALELTGFECPQTKKAREANTKVSAVEGVEYTDPIVRARLGLPEVSASAK